MTETMEKEPQTGEEEGVPEDKEEVKPINLAEIRQSTDLSEIERRLRDHPESAAIIKKIEKEAAKILGRDIVDIKSISLTDIREDLDKETKTVGIHKTPAEKLSEVIDALVHKADSISYVESLASKL